MNIMEDAALEAVSKYFITLRNSLLDQLTIPVLFYREIIEKVCQIFLS